MCKTLLHSDRVPYFPPGWLRFVLLGYKLPPPPLSLCPLSQNPGLLRFYWLRYKPRSSPCPFPLSSVMDEIHLAKIETSYPRSITPHRMDDNHVARIQASCPVFSLHLRWLIIALLGYKPLTLFSHSTYDYMHNNHIARIETSS